MSQSETFLELSPVKESKLSIRELNLWGVTVINGLLKLIANAVPWKELTITKDAPNIKRKNTSGVA